MEVKKVNMSTDSLCYVERKNKETEEIEFFSFTHIHLADEFIRKDAALMNKESEIYTYRHVEKDEEIVLSEEYIVTFH